MINEKSTEKLNTCNFFGSNVWKNHRHINLLFIKMFESNIKHSAMTKTKTQKLIFIFFDSFMYVKILLDRHNTCKSNVTESCRNDRCRMSALLVPKIRPPLAQSSNLYSVYIFYTSGKNKQRSEIVRTIKNEK